MDKTYRFRSLFIFLVVIAILLACKGFTPVKVEPTPTLEAVQVIPPTEKPSPTPARPTATPRPAEASPTPPEVSASPTTSQGGGIVAGKLEVTQVNSYQVEYGNWNIYGLVQNSTERSYGYVEVEADLLDADGRTVYTDTQGVAFNLLGPGETSPFSFYVSGLEANVQSVNAKIVSMDDQSYLERASVEVSADKVAEGEYNDIHYTGTIQNTGDQTAEIEAIAIGIFDKNKNLIYVDTYSAAQHEIEPGQSGPFRISVSLPEGVKDQIDFYTIFVDATKTSETSTKYDLVISPKTSHYQDSFGTYNLVGEVTNKHDKPLSVSLLMSYLDAEGKVIDVAFTSLPLYVLNPGDTVPFVFSYWGPLNSVPGVIEQAASYKIDVDWNYTWEVTTVTFDLATQNEASSMDGSDARFTGKVKNTSDATISSSTVIVALYDKKTGDLFAIGSASDYNEVAAGGTANYEIRITLPDGMDLKGFDIKILARGEKKE